MRKYYLLTGLLAVVALIGGAQWLAWIRSQ